MNALPDGLLLADKSAWQHASDPRAHDRWADALLSGRIVTSLPVRYQLLFSARDATTYHALEKRRCTIASRCPTC